MDVYGQPLRYSRRLRHQRFLTVYLPLLKKLVWWLLPHRTRRNIVGIFRFLVKPAENAKHSMPIHVVGFLGSAIGQGEGARLTALAMRQLGCAVVEIDIGNHFNLQDFGTDGDMPCLEEGTGTIIFHFNPDALIFSLMGAGSGALQNKRRVGYWAWETESIPQTWVDASTYLDEVWVPSEFVAQSVRTKCKLPVFVVPHPTAVKRAGFSNRKKFDIPIEPFVVLSMGSFHSTFDRKNLIGNVDAFRGAFGDDKGALLLIKVAHRSSRTLAQQRLLAEHIGDATNIRIIDEILSEQDIRDLIASADVFLSLHRSEGFGLALAEAMQAGTAVVATDWSGNRNFMDVKTAAMIPATMVTAIDSQGFFTDSDLRWAEPSIVDAVKWLRTLAENPEFRDEISTRARARVNEQLGLEGFRRTITAALGFDPSGHG